MATKYVQQATSQLGGAYDQQAKALQSQIPSIQNLYDTLTSGLNQQYQTNLNTGVQGIVEDASARGVLRSTLPVDARQSLTSELGAALQQSLGQLGAQRAQDIAGIQGKLGDLRIARQSAITDLASTLQQQDFAKQQFQQEMALRQQEAAARASSGGSTSVAQQKLNLTQELQQDIARAFGSKNAGQDYYTERTVLPALYQAYGVLGNDLINQAVYQYRKNALGY